MNDLKFAFRQLVKSPGFTAVSVLTLALGIGATTAIVSVIQTAVFDPLPVRHPERFVELGVVKEHGWSPGINPLALRALRDQTNLFARLVLYQFDGLTVPGEEPTERVRGVRVTPEFFALWNRSPLLGRTFSADEGQPGKQDVLVISHGLWQRQFGGDAAIVGRTVRFRERPLTVVGVMPPHFSFPTTHYEYWRPFEGPDPATDDLSLDARFDLWSSWENQVIAEMRPGVEPAEVQAFLEVISMRQAQEFNRGQLVYSFHARDLREMFIKPEVRRTLGLLLGTTAIVLLIVAANVANLQLARTETRQQEFAVRAALGAGRTRVFRQLLTESLLLALLGGGAGLAITAFGLDLLPKLISADLPRLKPISLNAGVLGIASAVTMTTGLFFGLAPAWQGGRANLSEVLKLGAATSTRDGRRGRFSRTLIVGQVALAFVLLAGAGLMVRSVIGMLRVDPGFDPHNVVRIYPGPLKVGDWGEPQNSIAARLSRFADARQRIAAIPGVIGTGLIADGRFGSDQHGRLGGVEVSTAPDSPTAVLKSQWIGVEDADPLRVLRVPLKRGRWLDRGDTGEGIPYVLVNETAARKLWPGEDAVGKQFRLEGGTLDPSMVGHAYQVVGVVSDTVEYSGRSEAAARYQEGPEPTYYRPLEMVDAISIAEWSLVVRTAVDPLTLHKPIHEAIRATGVDRAQPYFIDLPEVLRVGMAGHRTVMIYLSVFAGVGLLLAGLGLYGVLAYSVARRTREIGIRMALGARMADVIRLILRQGLALVAVGAVIGITVALATGRLLRAYLFGVSSTDPATFIAVALVLGVVTLLACWLPARRATRVNPIEALRSE